MNTHIRLILALIVTTLLAACSSSDSDKPRIAVSVEPQRALLSEIVGDRFEVITVLRPGSNPETFEPTIKDRKNIDRAAAYFTTGNLPFEQTLASSLPSTVTQVNVAKGITPVYGTHGHDGHHHDHGDADPHVWTSVRNSRIMARNMLDAVIALDPEGKDYYTERFNALDHRLDSLDQAFARQLSDIPVRAFAIWHPSLSYMARDYDLEQISVGFENKEMPAKRITEVTDEARKDGVRVFFFQKEYDSRQAETLNQQMGTRLITINPLAYDWEKELSKIVDALAR